MTTLAIPDLTPDDLPRGLRKRLVIDAVSGCWRLANGFHDRDGYAQWNGRYAHRRWWEENVGPVPDDWHVDHVKTRGCCWRDCIWLRHLEPVPVAVNNIRSNSASARNYRLTHCPKCNTEFDLLNTVFVGSKRVCRTCHPGAGTRPRKVQAVEQVVAPGTLAELGDAWDALLTFGRAA